MAVKTNSDSVDKAIGNAICTLLSIKPSLMPSYRMGIARTCKRLCHTADYSRDRKNGTDIEDTDIGHSLIAALNLNVKANGRVDTNGGDKTPMGLARTIKRVISEADYS